MLEAIQPYRGQHVGDWYVYTEREADEELESPAWALAKQAGLRAFAMAPNGDVWAIDPARGGEVVLLSHDLIWDGDATTVDAGSIRLVVSLSEALSAARAGVLPVDYWEARERLDRGESLMQARSICESDRDGVFELDDEEE